MMFIGSLVVSKESLQDLEKRAEESPVKYANLLIKCHNCKIIERPDGTIVFVPDTKGEQK